MKRNKNKSAAQRISNARLWLNEYCPFFGSMSMRLRLIEALPKHKVPTAAVSNDGAMYFNAKYVNGDEETERRRLTDPEVRGLLCHEVLHPAFMFFERLGVRNLLVANVAHDFAINLVIVDFAKKLGSMGGGIKLPEGGLFDEKYRDQAYEQIYKLIIDEISEGVKSGKIKVGEGDGSGRGMSIPLHDLNADCRPDLSTTAQGKRAAKGDTSAQEALGQKWQQALVDAAQVHEKRTGRGNLPGGLQAIIDEILNPTIDWREQLSAWLGENGGYNDLSWMRPSRRSEAVGELLPGRIRLGYPDITILWDTSGSMQGEEKNILPEVFAMCEDLGLTLRVIFIDCIIHADLEGVEDAMDIVSEIKGGGGSSFIPAFDRLREEGNQSVVIAFTDGYISVPSERPPTLQDVVWCVTSNGIDPAGGGYGVVINMQDITSGKNKE